MKINKKEIINNLLKENDADAIILYSPENRYWFSGFKSSLGYLIVTKKNSYLFLDGRYITAARNSKNIKNEVELVHFGKNVIETMKEVLKSENVKKLAFESDWVMFKQYEWYKKIFVDQTMVAVDCYQMRIIKDDWEIVQIKKACDITNEVFKSICAWIKPGISEKELQRYADNKFLELGAEKISFDTIIASGENGSMPHAVPTDKIINEGELVTIDMGCYFNGYCSDQTRTIAIGQVNEKLLDIYNTVFDAQSLGISMVKANENAGDIHRAVAKFINEKGYGEYFDHGLGHGIGVEIHEEPYQNATSQTILQPGMCITIEPGIYIPGIGGVRIEDDLLVTKDGYEMLTSAKRELIIINN